jgi:hypothetical protein
MQAHFRPQREAVRQLPRLWQLRSCLQLAELLQGPEQAAAMAHLSTPISLGQPAPFTPPPGHAAVPLDRTYLSSEGDLSGALLTSSILVLCLTVMYLHKCSRDNFLAS